MAVNDNNDNKEDIVDSIPVLAPEFEEPGFDMLQEAAHWAERLAGPTSAEERAEFDAWLAKRPAHEFAWAEMSALRHAAGPAAQEAALRDAALAPTHKQGRRWAVALAACAALLGAVYAVPEAALRLRADALTAVGEKHTMTLPDGTKVALNSASAVDVRFRDGRRDVVLLRGEAFFDVARDPAHPFFIAAGDSRIRVLGTHFNVRMDDGRTTVTVEEGKVRFGPTGRAGRHVILTAGQQAFVEGGAAQRQPVYDAQATYAWRDGQIIFYRTPLRDVVAEIERYHPAPVYVWGSGIGSRTVSGAFSTRMPDVALSNMVKLLGLRKMELPGGVVVIYD